MTEFEFYTELESINIKLSAKQKEIFEKYFNYLIEYNKSVNLTSITDKKEVYLKHFYDSLLVAKYYKFTNEKVLDIGTGPGFPSVPLLICFPNIKLTVLDSNNKKILFLNSLKNLLNIDFEIVNDRAENYIKNEREKFDIVLSRAVANLKILSELAIPFLKINGIFISYKSNIEEEIKNIDHTLKELSASLLKIESTTLKDNIVRTFVFITKEKSTNLKYPREFKKIKKSPL